MNKEFIFIDHLKEHMKGLATKEVQSFRDSLPKEFADIPDGRLIDLIADQATPILRKIEDEALSAGIEKMARLIRYSQSRE